MDAKQTETAAGIIHGLCLEVERISGQLQNALAWAALWKRAARGYRANYRWGKRRLENAKADNQRQAAEIERLREALMRVLMCGNYDEMIEAAESALQEPRP